MEKFIISMGKEQGAQFALVGLNDGESFFFRMQEKEAGDWRFMEKTNIPALDAAEADISNLIKTKYLA